MVRPPAAVPRLRTGSRPCRSGRVPVRRLAVHPGRPGRGQGPAAGHDAAHLPGHPGRSFAASATSALGLFDLEFWWELALLIVIMLLGHWLEMRALGQASRRPRRPGRPPARPGRPGRRRPGRDRPRGRPGRRRPRARPPRRPGAGRRGGHRRRGRAGRVDDHRRVPPGARGPGRPGGGGHGRHRHGRRVRVDAVGETALAGIRRLVEQAQASGSRAQALADRTAAWLFYVRPRGRTGHRRRLAGLGEPDQAVDGPSRCW